MKRHLKMIPAAGFYSVCFAVLMAAHASAYIDPATTSYIIQIVVGVVIACGTTFGIIFNKMRRKLKKKDENAGAGKVEMSETHKGGVVTAEDLMSDDGEKSESGSDGE